MKTISITTWQRTILAQIVSELRGAVGVVVVAMPVLETLRLNKEEEEMVGLFTREDGVAEWEKADHRWDLSFGQKEMGLIVNAVMQYQGWPMGNADQIMDLLNQLEVSI